MPVPHAVARFNKRVTNRFIEPLASRRRWFGVVHHVGRNSGRSYRTPVRLFDAGESTWSVVLTYGRRADWVQNVLAQQERGDTAEVQDRSGRWPIGSIHVVARSAGDYALPALIRLALRWLTIDEMLHITPADGGREDLAHDTLQDRF